MREDHARRPDNMGIARPPEPRKEAPTMPEIDTKAQMVVPVSMDPVTREVTIGGASFRARERQPDGTMFQGPSVVTQTQFQRASALVRRLKANPLDAWAAESLRVLISEAREQETSDGSIAASTYLALSTFSMYLGSIHVELGKLTKMGVGV